MTNTLSQDHILLYQLIKYDICNNIIFNPYIEYDISNNINKTIINELQKNKIYYNTNLENLLSNKNNLNVALLIKQIKNNYNKEIIYNIYINKSIMYLYLMEKDKEHILKIGYSDNIHNREPNLKQEYESNTYLLGLYEIPCIEYEKMFHKLPHMKELKFKMTKKKKTKKKDISGNNIYRENKKEEIYILSPRVIFEYFSYGIYVSKFLNNNSVLIEQEKTKQIEIEAKEKTKQIEIELEIKKIELQLKLLNK
jgi:hypothetical protein